MRFAGNVKRKSVGGPLEKNVAFYLPFHIDSLMILENAHGEQIQSRSP